MKPEVDFDLLAEKTAGYSGDDITGVCRDAAMNGMRRKILGKTPEQIRCVGLGLLALLIAFVLPVIDLLLELLSLVP